MNNDHTISCSECKFYFSLGNADVDGECRKNPPIIIDNDVNAVFPVTNDLLWCGEFARNFNLEYGDDGDEEYDYDVELEEEETKTNNKINSYNTIEEVKEQHANDFVEQKNYSTMIEQMEEVLDEFAEIKQRLDDLTLLINKKNSIPHERIGW